MRQKPTVLSLFSGCGGLDLGFVLAGYDLLAAYDHWAPAVETHNRNSHLLGGTAHKKSLALADGEIELSRLPRADIIIGGPPCQGFSFAGKQRIDDPRNFLYLDFKRIIEFVNPKLFLMENVRGLEAMALEDIKRSFLEIKYNVTVDRVRAVDLGIPQRRERIIIVGTRAGESQFRTPELLLGSLFGAMTPQCIMDAIGDLPEPTQADKSVSATKDYLEDHRYQPLSELEQKFIKHIPNGGSFMDAPRSSLPDRLIKIYDDPIAYKSPRLFPKADPFKPSQTIPASTSPSIGGVIAPDFVYRSNRPVPVSAIEHTARGVYTTPTFSRRFTPREIARLQGFPDDFLFSGSTSTKTKMIGNAVPVKISALYAEEIKTQFF
jgi:DNA (cytosine-5)-methyltransferase 1